MGKPLYIEKLTKNRDQISYACMLVEVDISKELPKIIQIASPVGIDINIELQFESMIRFCVDCRQIGHISIDYKELEGPC